MDTLRLVHSGSRRLSSFPVVVWAATAMLVVLTVWLRPQRTVFPLYVGAAERWGWQQPIYDGPRGMNYLPQFMLLLAPFHVLPVPWGDAAWRLVGVVLLGTGLRRVSRLLFDAAAPQFFWVTLLTLPLGLEALCNAQANVHLTGLLLHSAAFLAQGHSWRGALGLGLALAVKPLALVMSLLAPAVYPALRWRFPLVVAALAAAPFLFAPSDYVLSQYHDAVENLRSCARVSEHRFADLNGIWRTFGTELPSALALPIRLLAALATAAFFFVCWRGAPEPLRALGLNTASVIYLMLFNPMTEANSYVLLAPALAFWAVLWLGQPNWSRAGRLTCFAALSMGLLPEPLRRVFGNAFALFWHPCLTLVFAGLFVWFAVGRFLQERRLDRTEEERAPAENFESLPV